MPILVEGAGCLFQSAPGGEAGGNPLETLLPVDLDPFQSAPGGEAGGNRCGPGNRLKEEHVSIRPRR